MLLSTYASKFIITVSKQANKVGGLATAIVSVLIVASISQGQAAPSKNLSQGFYTIVDADGRLINIPKKSAELQSRPKKTPSVNQKNTIQDKTVTRLQEPLMTPDSVNKIADEATADDQNSTDPLSKKVTSPISSRYHSESDIYDINPSNPKDNTVSDNIASSKPELLEYQDETYVDSELLIKKQFNMDDKKRFYSVPNGMGKFDIVERRADLTPEGDGLPSLAEQLTRQIELAPNYRRVSTETLQQVFGEQCFEVPRKHKTLTGSKQVNIWPRTPIEDKLTYNVVGLSKSVQFVTLISYANKQARPEYYWPFPVFLDQQGCMIEGVSNYYQAALPETLLQRQALKGVIRAPNEASYLLLTPVTEIAGQPNITTTAQGAVKLAATATQ